MAECRSSATAVAAIRTRGTRSARRALRRPIQSLFSASRHAAGTTDALGRPLPLLFASPAAALAAPAAAALSDFRLPADPPPQPRPTSGPVAPDVPGIARARAARRPRRPRAAAPDADGRRRPRVPMVPRPRPDRPARAGAPRRATAHSGGAAPAEAAGRAGRAQTCCARSVQPGRPLPRDRAGALRPPAERGPRRGAGGSLVALGCSRRWRRSARWASPHGPGSGAGPSAGCPVAPCRSSSGRASRQPRAAAPAAAPAEPLQVTLEPLRLSLTLMNATLAYRLESPTAAPRRSTGLAIGADMISAHASMSREEQLSGPRGTAPRRCSGSSGSSPAKAAWSKASSACRSRRSCRSARATPRCCCRWRGSGSRPRAPRRWCALSWSASRAPRRGCSRSGSTRARGSIPELAQRAFALSLPAARSG